MVTLASAIRAATLIVAREILLAVGHTLSPATTIGEICSWFACGRTQAYELVKRLRDAVTDLKRTPGRPCTPPVAAEKTVEVLRAAYRFLMDNPGCVQGKGERRFYGDGFRRLVVGLRDEGQPGDGITVEQLAELVDVPLGTLKDWVSPIAPPCGEAPRAMQPLPAGTDEELPGIEIADPRIAVILTEYRPWKGTFGAFVEHLQREHRLPFQRTFVGTILQAAGLRTPRPRRKPGAPWSRDTFLRLFPGFQWLGDGKAIVVECNDQRFGFNLEAIVDAASNGVLGFKVTDVEDEAAVLSAFDAAKATAGGPPLALTLDNRPSNDTPGIRDGIDPAVLLHATPGRGQAKAPVEGTFGLFSQTAPPLVLAGATSREIARSFAQAVATTWAWARNHRPRRRLGGKTPAETYPATHPTPEQLANAKASILELRRREDLARRTRQQRADPVRLQILRENLLELGIDDPENRLATWLAGYAKDAILEGLAVFRAKREMATIPRDADPGRYLGGIIRNTNERSEHLLFADHLLRLRLRDRELSLAPLQTEADRLRASGPPASLVERFVDKAIEAVPVVDFRFWMLNASDAMCDRPPAIARAIYAHLVRRTAASFGMPRDRRRDLIAALSASVPLADG